MTDTMNIELRTKTPEPDILNDIAKVLFILVSLGVALYLFFQYKNIAFGIASVCVSALVYMFIEALQPPSVAIIQISDAGILDRRTGLGVILWQDILEARLEMQGPYLCLRLRDPEIYFANLSQDQKKKIEFNHELGFRMLNLGLRGLAVNPINLLDLVRKQIAQHNQAV